MRVPLKLSALNKALRNFHKKASASWLCEKCGTRLRLYEHKLDAGKVVALIEIAGAMLRRGHWIKAPELVRRGVAKTDLGYGKLDLWRLAEKHPSKDGYWRVTELGFEFLRGDIKVHRFAIILTPQKRFQKFAGDLIDVREALESRFDLNKLLKGVSCL